MYEKNSTKERPNYYAVIPANVRYDKELTPNAKLLYGEITALCNQEGYCWATNEYFSKLYKVSKVTVSRWIKELKEKGYINVDIIYKNGSKEIDYRYIQICIEGINKNDNTPINKIVKDNNTSTNNTYELKEIYKERFLTFYELYPKKVKKKDAEKWFLKNKPDEELFKQIMEGLKKHLKSKQWKDKQYIPYPTTWLNGERWNDEVEESDGETVPDWMNKKIEAVPPSKEELKKMQEMLKNFK